MPLPPSRRLVQICWVLLVNTLLHVCGCVWVIVDGVATTRIDLLLGTLVSIVLSVAVLRLLMVSSRVRHKLQRIEPSLHADSLCCMLSFFTVYVFIGIGALRNCSMTREPKTSTPSFVYLMCSTIVCIMTNLFIEVLRQKSIRELVVGRFNDTQVPVTFDDAHAADRIIDMSESHHD